MIMKLHIMNLLKIKKMNILRNKSKVFIIFNKNF